MRRLAWFVIIVLIIVAGVSIACAYDEGTKIWIVNGLTRIGGVVWTSVSAGWGNLAAFVGTSGVYFLIYTIGILFVGGILFYSLVPKVKGSSKLAILPKRQVTPTMSTVTASTPVGATTRPDPAIKEAEEMLMEGLEEEGETKKK